MSDDVELHGLGLLDDHDLAELAALGAEMQRTGESYLHQLLCEKEIRLVAEKRARLTAAAAKVRPDDPRQKRVQKIIATLDAELTDCRFAFLRAWRPDNRIGH
jgi:uncharacterized protein YdaU (DUF1376 family)